MIIPPIKETPAIVAEDTKSVTAAAPTPHAAMAPMREFAADCRARGFSTPMRITVDMPHGAFALDAVVDGHTLLVVCDDTPPEAFSLPMTVTVCEGGN